MKKTPTKRRRARRETTDRISSIAARVLFRLGTIGNIRNLYDDGAVAISMSEVKALAASCLNQDQTPGPLAKRKGARRK